MSGLFTIPLGGLKKGCLQYDFEIGDKFFEEFEESEIKEGTLLVNIELVKQPSHFDLIVRIAGKVRISCDRCLELFFQHIECEHRLLVKLGEKWDDSDPDIITIPADEHELDIKKHLYEFIHLALPIQRVHPEGQKGTSFCNPDMLKKLSRYIVKEEKETDPRWDELKKLINNN